MDDTYFERRKSCPACGSAKFSIIYQKDYNDPLLRDYLTDFYCSNGMVEYQYLNAGVYILCECDACGLIFQRDIPNGLFMARIYEHWIDPKKVFNLRRQQDSLAIYAKHAQEIMQIISYFRRAPTTLSFFDFGMGWGQWALMAKAFGCDSYGSELSPSRIEHAKSKGIKVVTWEEMPESRFDFINTEQVFEHIPEPLQTLRHLRRALKANGICKISVPTASYLRRRLEKMKWKAAKGSKDSLNLVAPLEHINCFRRSSLLKMAEAADMQEVLIPMKVQYRYMPDWSTPKKIARNLGLPIYRNLLKRPNYIFLRNIQEDVI
ncbi:Methyltransferase family protein [uncultured Desulfatiglans sp.]|uniref:Methyltransferase family protein n=1 Tax=Uncultured Desulfatiglans sp. TaxID=1748965 RepID=A0A653A6F0_UNCDX|nr:Methyltransferase family protein [uncultured Desulfatiglans sp.]